MLKKLYPVDHKKCKILHYDPSPTDYWSKSNSTSMWRFRTPPMAELEVIIILRRHNTIPARVIRKGVTVTAVAVASSYSNAVTRMTLCPRYVCRFRRPIRSERRSAPLSGTGVKCTLAACRPRTLKFHRGNSSRARQCAEVDPSNRWRSYIFKRF